MNLDWPNGLTSSLRNDKLKGQMLRVASSLLLVGQVCVRRRVTDQHKGFLLMGHDNFVLGFVLGVTLCYSRLVSFVSGPMDLSRLCFQYTHSRLLGLRGAYNTIR